MKATPSSHDLSLLGTPSTLSEEHSFVVVSNRLPIDRVISADGEAHWQHSPGGLVTALEPVMQRSGGAWVGWAGQPDFEPEPFDSDGIRIVPVGLSFVELEEYYEGFSNGTLWPLYHDVIAPPTYHREWWDSYSRVNRRFADAAASVSAKGATVWVQDYQLQLVPRLLREARPDLRIGFFNHIPFPSYDIFSQLPWRTSIIEGLLGADVIGFQRSSDAYNFTTAVRRLKGYSAKGTNISVPLTDLSPGVRRSQAPAQGTPSRKVVAKHFPISIDVETFTALANDPKVQERAKQIRRDLGNPQTVILGIDRLDYTKGIGHRLKAFGELLAEAEITVGEVTMVQVASPSRERIIPYMELRDEIELMVGRLNGDHATTAHNPISYHHNSYPRDEMVAMYLAADIMLVTALRDGMNLVAKEYVASRIDNDGVLILSEFAGAADELKRALLVNPHDIEGLKSTILTALNMPAAERKSRMRFLRKKVLDHDVSKWSSEFLAVLAETKND